MTRRGLRFVLVYPNTERTGRSNLGFLLVRKNLQEMPGVQCESAFFSAGDGRAGGRGAPRSEETGTPLSAFDVIAFSVSYECDLPRAVEMLHDAGVTTSGRERRRQEPLVVMGGVGVAANPEPASGAADIVVLGDGEIAIPVLVGAVSESGSRAELFDRLCGEEGFYVPSLYDAAYSGDGTRLERFEATGKAPPRLRPALGLAAQRRPLTAGKGSDLGGKHLIEIGRGCNRGCRFCWMGYRERPAVFFDEERILAQARLRPAGSEGVGLIAPSPGDHHGLGRILGTLAMEGIPVSLSSLRVDGMSRDRAGALVRAGMRSVTLAPEAGTARLRRVLNKPFSDDDVVAASGMLFEAGMASLKLYFMIGLPTEDDDDVMGIPRLVRRVKAELLRVSRRRGRIGRIRVTAGLFVPKPHTPFQWAPMAGRDALKRRTAALRKALARLDNVTLSTASLKEAETAALLSLGGRPVADLLDQAASEGRGLLAAARGRAFPFDGIIRRPKDRDEPFPWDFIDTGVKREYLWKEYRSGLAGRLTAPCEPEGCTRCGVCPS